MSDVVGPLVLAVPDGASEPVGDGPTALERAATPTWDRLAAAGVALRVRTTPAGLPPGSEVGLPTLLGVRLTASPSRGRLDAAAAGVGLADGEAAWRLDADRALTGAAVAAVARALAPLGAVAHPLGGHRMLLVDPAGWGDAPDGPHQPGGGSGAGQGPWGEVAGAAAAALAAVGLAAEVRPWGRAGVAGELTDLPERHGLAVEVVTGGGAMPGVAAAVGAALRGAPPGEVVAAAPDGALVVLHDPRPDEAGHARDAEAKAAALAAFDAEVLAPAAAALADRGAGALAVCPDHGCDPATGAHTAEAAPATVWSPTAPAPPEAARPPTERGVADLAELAGHRLVGDALGAGRRAAAAPRRRAAPAPGPAARPETAAQEA